jgi:glycosyltransferase involved in cell wall biosynthesis
VKSVFFDARRASWYPEIGLSRYARSLLAAMLTMRPQDLQIIPLDLDGSGNWTSEPTIRLGPGHHFLQRLEQEQVRIASKSRRADLLHLPWFEGPLYPGCPLVVTIHDLDTLSHPKRYPLRFRVYYNSLLRRYVRVARRIITTSHATLEALRERWPSQRYEVIYQGVDAVFRASDSGHSRSSEPFILYSGGWGQRKRLDLLLSACQRLWQAQPEVRLVATGVPGNKERELMERTGSDRIVLPGRVTDATLAELYQNALVVAYPSAMEGFGFPIVEAFASGTPVVALKSGAVSEIAGDAALLVEGEDADDYAEALLTVIRDARLTKELSERGLLRVRNFSWAETARRTLEVYRSVLSES